MAKTSPKTLKEAAELVRQHGRYGDSVLIHVRPEEAAMLAMPTGGKLTVNPDTGLPEAFLPFLASLLGSWLAPGALGAMGVTGLSPTLMSAIGSGLGTYAATGDVEKGLMGGLFGFGAGQLANAATGAGMNAVTNAATQAATTAAPLQAAQALTQGVGTAGQAAAQAASGAAGLTPQALNAAQGLGAGLNAVPQAVNAANMMASPVQNMVQGLANAPQLAAGSMTTTVPLTDQLATKANLMWKGIQSDPSVLSKGMIPMTMGSGAFAEAFKTAGMTKEEKERAKRAGIEKFPMARSVVQPPAGYRPGIDPEFNYFASAPGYANGGLMDMLGESESDGSSDSIMGLIDGRQPAKLSQGEYVLPSDVVAHIGNGSSEAGAKRLQALVTKVRKTKTGSGKLPARV